MGRRCHIIGAPRCGTTSLYQWLNTSDDVSFPTYKEAEFSVTDKQTNTCGTANPRHFTNKFSTGLFSADDKLIVLVRHPVERAYSHWHRLRVVAPQIEQDDFLTAIQRNKKRIAKSGLFTNYDCRIKIETDLFFDNNYLEAGLYYEQLKKFVGFDVHIMLVDDLNEENCRRHLCDWLGIDYIRSKMLKTNQGNQISVNDEQKAEIRDFYREDITKFNKMYDCEVTMS